MQKKEKKLLKRFWDWPFPPLKVDADADADADDDGQVGIWKAPLPGGTAELKSSKLKQKCLYAQLRHPTCSWLIEILI